MSTRLLLLSNSRDPAGGFLVYPRRQIRAFLGGRIRSALFIPFASVGSWDEYTDRVRGAFHDMGYAIVSIHDAERPLDAVRDAEAVVIGGGNTFHLLDHLHRTGLVPLLRELTRAGVPYIGWSAGAVIACPSIKTTNDMPIVEPPTLAALALVPFQINAHYTDFHPPGLQGETRAERLAEFLALNREMRVVGLPEGTMLQVEHDRIVLHGNEPARLFEHGCESSELHPDQPLDFLLAPPARASV